MGTTCGLWDCERKRGLARGASVSLRSTKGAQGMQQVCQMGVGAVSGKRLAHLLSTQAE